VSARKQRCNALRAPAVDGTEGQGRFGESAPATGVHRHLGLTVDNLVATVQAVSFQEKQS
jgi:transketolase